MAEPKKRGTEPKKNSSKPQLGVLFVHGIGQQVAGQTLVQYADPLSRWLTRWLTQGERTEAAVGSREGERVHVGETVLASGDEPAHLLMKIDAGADIPEAGTQSWLLAESWWAETFRPPSTRALLLWLLLVMPYLVLVQFYSMFLRAKRKQPGWRGRFVRFVRMVAFGVVYVSALPLAALAAGLLVVLLAAILVPIPQISERAKKAALTFSNTLGDSFVLASSAVQFDAMVNRVTRDLDWLSGEAQSVIVVAHSQGTAVSYHAIAGYNLFPKNLRAFITVGQAIKKLNLVRDLQTYGDDRRTATRLPASRQEWRSSSSGLPGRAWNETKTAGVRWLRLKTLRFAFAWGGIVGIYGLAYSILQLLYEIRHHQPTQWRYVLVGGIGLGLMLAVCLICDKLWHDDSANEPKELKRGKVTLRWADFYASADPVPNGPLFSETAGRSSWLREQEVWNSASVLRDHTTYAASEDDFMGSLVEEALGATGAKLPNDALEQLKHARWRGWWRVWWLTFARALVAVAGVVTAIRVRHHVPQIGDRLIKWGKWEPAHTLGKGLVAAVRKLIIVGHPQNNQLVGALVVLAVLASGYALVSVVWSYWQQQDIKRFYRRISGDEDTDPLGGREFLWFFLSLCLLSAVAITVGYTQDYAAAWNWTSDHIIVSLGILAVLIVLPILLMWPLRKRMRGWERELERRLARDVPDPPDPLEGTAAVLV